MRDDDSALLRACQAGDQEAWDRLVDRYGRLVYSIPRRYGLNDPDADDVFQNVFASLFRAVGTIRDHARLPSWLITTAHRECWRVRRRGGAGGDPGRTIEDVGAPAPQDASRWEQQHLVRLALTRLGGRCEDLLKALFMQGSEIRYEAIAERLSMKVGSIGPTRARCFRKMEAILRDLGVAAEEDPASPDAPG